MASLRTECWRRSYVDVHATPSVTLKSKLLRAATQGAAAAGATTEDIDDSSLAAAGSKATYGGAAASVVNQRPPPSPLLCWRFDAQLAMGGIDANGLTKRFSELKASNSGSATWYERVTFS